MRRHLALAVLLIGWLCANGAAWNVVQAIAWARMFTGYVQTLPATEALKRTFDGQDPCELCQIVQVGSEAAREQSRATAPIEDATRFVLALAHSSALTFPTARPDWPALVDFGGDILADSVPLPPPRAA